MNETDFHVSFSMFNSIFVKVDTMSYDNGICGEWNPARFESVQFNSELRPIQTYCVTEVRR